MYSAAFLRPNTLRYDVASYDKKMFFFTDKEDRAEAGQGNRKNDP
jgi:hypothetical protein